MKLLPVLGISLFLFTVNVSAQTTCTIAAHRLFKIKLERTISSATARESDYVQFTTLEDIYCVDSDTPVIPKDTIVFGVVTRRKHRHFPFKKGELEVQLEPMRLGKNAVETKVSILRRTPVPGAKPQQGCKGVAENCISGRKNGVVAPIVEAVAATGGAIVAGVADAQATRIIALAGLFELVSNGGITELVNGTDSQLEEGEIFDMLIPTKLNVPPPEKPKGEK
jgi:hypothetical protein